MYIFGERRYTRNSVDGTLIRSLQGRLNIYVYTYLFIYMYI